MGYQLLPHLYAGTMKEGTSSSGYLQKGQKRAIWIVVVSARTNVIKPLAAVYKKADTHDFFLMGKPLEWY